MDEIREVRQVCFDNSLVAKDYMYISDGNGFRSVILLLARCLLIVNTNKSTYDFSSRIVVPSRTIQ